jgi:hypothetical protein
MFQANTRCRCPTHIAASRIRRPRMRCSPFSRCVTQGPRTTARMLLSPVPTTSSTPWPFDPPPRQCRAPRTPSLPPAPSIPPSYPLPLLTHYPSLFSARLFPLPTPRVLLLSQSKAPINPGARTSESRAPLRPTDSRPRLACRRVGRVCWSGAMSGAVRALSIVQAHMSASSTATSTSTSLPFPLLSFFPPPVLVDRSADAPLPIYPR